MKIHPEIIQQPHLFSDGTSQNITASAVWAYHLPLHASMDSSVKGKLVTKAVTSDQTAAISASYTYNGVTKSGSMSVIIKDKTLISVSVTGSASVSENSSANYTATAYFSDGTNQNVTASVTWSENLSYASFDSYTKGKLVTQAVTSNQSATLTASYIYSGVTKSGTKTVTITDTKILTSVSVSGSSSVIGTSYADCTATATFSNGTSQNVTASAVWTESESTSYTYMDSSVKGRLKINPINVTITASYTYNGVTKSGSKVITVR